MARSKGFLAAANFVDAVVPVAFADFGGRGLWRWPFLVEGGLSLAKAAGLGARQRRFLRAQILADSVTLD